MSVSVSLPEHSEGLAVFIAAYLADEYSIADIATYPWVARHEWHRVDLAAFPAVKRWYDTIGARPAVVRGMAVPPA